MTVRFLQFILLVCLAAVILPRVSSAGTVAYYSYSNSLYDERTALAPTVQLQTIFGPKSSHIHYDARMIHAAEIALARAHQHSTERCWHSVKNALLDAQVVSTRPSSEYAKEAGEELQWKYGFTKLRIFSPFDAPVGAVLVYGGRGAGHVEIRTTTGFVSDFVSLTPSPRPLLGVYVKRS